jgi:hypothetical protein
MPVLQGYIQPLLVAVWARLGVVDGLAPAQMDEHWRIPKRLSKYFY